MSHTPIRQKPNATILKNIPKEPAKRNRKKIQIMKKSFSILNLKNISVLLLFLFVCIIISCKKDCQEKECTESATTEYDPVCGCNGVTYGNPSVAVCHGIENFTQGACKQQ